MVSKLTRPEGLSNGELVCHVNSLLQALRACCFRMTSAPATPVALALASCFKPGAGDPSTWMGLLRALSGLLKVEWIEKIGDPTKDLLILLDKLREEGDRAFLPLFAFRRVTLSEYSSEVFFFFFQKKKDVFFFKCKLKTILWNQLQIDPVDQYVLEAPVRTSDTGRPLTIQDHAFQIIVEHPPTILLVHADQQQSSIPTELQLQV